MNLQLVLDVIEVTEKTLLDEAEAAEAWMEAHREALASLGGAAYMAGVAAGTKTAISDYTKTLKQTIFASHAMMRTEPDSCV